MNRKYGIVFGAVAITLLMISSATAVTTAQNQKENQEKIVHIDSNIIITKKLLSKLNDAYNNIEDGDFKILLGEIIELLKTKKVVNSNDIKKIIDDNNLAVNGAYFARGISTNGKWGYCAGNCGLKPIGIIPYIFGFFYWHAIASSWSEVGVNVRVGSDTYTYDHNGLVIGYFGFGSNSWTYDMTYGLRERFMAGGVGSVIFVA